MGTTNPNKATGSAIFNFLPGTIVAQGGVGFMNIGSVGGPSFQISHELATRVITKNFTDRLFTAEFDDSLVDQATRAIPDVKVGNFEISNNPETDIGKRSLDFLTEKANQLISRFRN